MVNYQIFEYNSVRNLGLSSINFSSFLSHNQGMATVTEKLGAKIRKLRRKKSLTQEKLAEMARIDYSYLNTIENGKRNPSLQIVAKIARALGVRLNELTTLK